MKKLKLNIMADLENRKIKNDTIIGTISINLQGCKKEFEICSVEEWKELTEEKAEELAEEMLWESGIIDWWY